MLRTAQTPAKCRSVANQSWQGQQWAGEWPKGRVQDMGRKPREVNQLKSKMLQINWAGSLGERTKLDVTLIAWLQWAWAGLPTILKLLFTLGVGSGELPLALIGFSFLEQFPRWRFSLGPWCVCMCAHKRVKSCPQSWFPQLLFRILKIITELV